MKKLQIRMLVVLVLAQFAFFTIAELNYSNAIKDAVNSEGSDAAIQAAMLEHGFNAQAMGPAEPTLLDKSAALISLL